MENNINEALSDIYNAMNVMNEKITRIFTTLAGDQELMPKGMLHRIDELENQVNDLKQYKNKINAAIITTAAISSILGSVFSYFIK